MLTGGGVSSTNAAQRVDSRCSRNRMKPAQTAVKPSPMTMKASTPMMMYRPLPAATSSAQKDCPSDPARRWERTADKNLNISRT